MANKIVIEQFLEFINNDVEPAFTEIKKLSDANRIHVQRLVYTNVVDRFDYLLDGLLLASVTIAPILDGLLGEMKSPITEAELLQYFLPNNLGATNRAINRLQDQLRGTVLRQRHAKKLAQLCKALIPKEDAMKPRVNGNTGQVLAQMKGHKSIPNSIVGYADWLYCRRSAIVHGGNKRQVGKEDLAYLTRSYSGVKSPSKEVRLRLASINNAMTFYRCVCAQLLQSKLLDGELRKY